MEQREEEDEEDEEEAVICRFRPEGVKGGQKGLTIE